MADFVLTDALLKKWKKDHEAVHEIEVDVVHDTEQPDVITTYKCYVRKPEIDDILAAQTAPTDAKKGLIIFSACYLGGDEYIQKNSEARLAAANKTVPLFKVPVARIKKL